MLAVNIKIDEASLKEAERILATIPGAYKRVVKRSVKRSIDMAYTRYKRTISDSIGINKTTVGKGLKKSFDALSADPTRLPLGAFKAKQVKQTKAVLRKIARGVASRLGTGLGVRYRIGAQWKMLPGAFLAMLVGKKGGSKGDLKTTSAERITEWQAAGLSPKQIRRISHRGIMRRVTRRRLPIYEYLGPSVWRIAMHEPGIAKELLKKTEVDFSRLINDQIGLELRRWSK